MKEDSWRMVRDVNSIESPSCRKLIRWRRLTEGETNPGIRSMRQRVVRRQLKETATNGRSLPKEASRIWKPIRRWKILGEHWTANPVRLLTFPYTMAYAASPVEIEFCFHQSSSSICVNQLWWRAILLKETNNNNNDDYNRNVFTG